MYVADISDQCPPDLAANDGIWLSLRCDVTQREACKDFLDSIPGRLDGLVNCAGTSAWEGKIATDDLFQHTMNINVTGTWNMGTAQYFQRLAQHGMSGITK